MEVKLPNQNPPKIIDAITTPLGFFVLSLLIVETFLGSAFFSSGIEPKQKITCIWLGVSLFVFVVIIVTLLVWHKADNLTFDNKSHLIDRGKMVPFGTSDNPLMVENITEIEKSTPTGEN